MKRLILLAAIAAAAFAAACNGGSSVVPPPTPTGNFSNSSLKGQYTFSMAGEDLSGGNIARVGSFIADGTGKISGALEDVNDEGAAIRTVSFSGGSYSIDANGHGSMQFLQGTTVALQFSIVLSSTASGLMVQTDLNATSSGNFILASATTPATFSLSQISGNYVFDVAGVKTVQAVPLTDVGRSIVGQLKTNGSTVSGGVLDVNDGQSGLSGPIVISSGNSYQLDPSNGNGTNFGRGTMTITAGGSTLNFVFYIVDATHFKLLETDAGLLTSGDAISQQTPPANSAGFTGSFAMLLGGSDTAGPLAETARFTADGSQNLNTVFLDFNDAGTLGAVTSPSAATYTIDTANANSGRGTMTFTDAKLGQFNFVFYLISSTQGVIQDTSTGVVADGSLEAQTGGPFSATSVAGNYAVNWTGVNLGSSNSAVFEEDFLGQYVLPLPSGQQHNGVIDIVQLGSTGKNFIPNDPVSLTLNIGGDGSQSNPQYDFLTADSPTTDYKFKVYFVNQQRVYLLGNLSSSVYLGVAEQQH